MKQILVLIENELEQSITGDILRSGLGAERWISSLWMLNGLTWPTAI